MEGPSRSSDLPSWLQKSVDWGHWLREDIIFALPGLTQLHERGLKWRCKGCSEAMALLSPTAPLSQLLQSGTEQPGSRDSLDLL